MITFTLLAWFIVTILMMAFFAGIEMAFYSVNRLGVELKKKQGKPGAVLLSKLIENREVFLSTTLIGFTFFLVCFALLFSAVTQPLWTTLGIKYNSVRIGLEIILATFIVLILGEFIPRSIFRANSTIILSRLVWVINLFYQLFQPIAKLLVNLAKWVAQYIFNFKINESTDADASSTADTLFQPGNDPDSEAQRLDTELFDNALNLHNIKVRQCLVPRKEVIGMEIKCTPEQAREKFIETKLSKLVVYENNIDHIIGYIHQLDMYKHSPDVNSILHPIPAVPETMSAIDLINKFTKERKSIAWVVDEFGGTAGIVTMEDVLEEIFGEIHDEYDSEEFVEKRLAENEYIFSGRLELDYLCEKYDLQFPDNDAETLSGYIISDHGTIPEQKERIFIDDYEFDILNVSETRIEMVKMKVLK